MSHGTQPGSSPEDLGARENTPRQPHEGPQGLDRFEQHFEHMGRRLILAEAFGEACSEQAADIAAVWEDDGDNPDRPVASSPTAFARGAVLTALSQAQRAYGPPLWEMVDVAGVTVHVRASVAGAGIEAEPWHGAVEWRISSAGARCGPFETQAEVDQALGRVRETLSGRPAPRDVFWTLEALAAAPVEWPAAVTDEDIWHRTFLSVRQELQESAARLTMRGPAVRDSYGWGLFNALEVFLAEFQRVHLVDIREGGLVRPHWLEDAEGLWLARSPLDASDDTVSVRVEGSRRLRVWRVDELTDGDDENLWRGSVDGHGVPNRATEDEIKRETVAAAWAGAISEGGAA